MKHISAHSGSFVPASHEDPASPGVLKRVIATHRDLPSGQVMMVNWARLPGGSAFQSHYHEDMHEVFVLISGRVRMTVSDAVVEMAAGDTVIVEPLEIHSMQNLMDSIAEYVVFGLSVGHGGRTVVVNQ
ncbi:MAG: cupin domain-containing protein [Fuerstiella sp.]|nr:cupin domain-containing protein [Fuerstiella sp.]